MDSNGNLTAVFGIAPPFKIWASERTLLGAWSAPVQLSALGNDGIFPAVGVDAGGNVTAVWFDDVSSNVFAATKPLE